MPTGRYTDIIGRLRPNAMEPGDIVDLDGRVHRPASGHCQFHRRPAQGPRHCGQPPALCGAARRRAPPRRGRPARGAADGPHRAARRQLDRRRRARVRDRRRHRDVRARCARPGRRSRPGCARVAGGYEIELVAGEEGVSPGQACVFYDAPSGQARVLGGGFIKSATASNAQGKRRHCRSRPCGLRT